MPKNIPVQTCANVCGVAAAVLAGIACVSSYLWRNVFLNRNAEIPTSLEWLLKPTVYSDFLRCSIISWLLTNSINLSILGITREQVKPQLRDHNFTFRRRFLGEVTILDDGHADKNQENVKNNNRESPSGDSCSKDEASRMQNLSEGWITLQYGKKRKKVDNQRKTNKNSTREASSSKKNGHVNSRGNSIGYRRKRSDRSSVDCPHGSMQEKRGCQKVDDEDKIPYDATISNDECVDFYQHNTVTVEPRGNSKSNLEENNRVPPSPRSKKPGDVANRKKKCDDNRIKVRQGRKVKKVNTQRKRGRLDNNMTTVDAAPRKHGQSISARYKHNGSLWRKNDSSWNNDVNGLKEENVGFQMAAGEDMIHKKDDRSSDDVANSSKEENIGCEMEDGEDMFHKHCEDRKLKKESTRPFHKEIDEISKHLQTTPLQRMKYPVWENKGNTEGVLKEEEKNQAEISENDEESICTGDALGYSSKRAVDGMLNVGNQKQLRETIDEIAMFENTVGDKKFEDDKENCCLFRRTL